MRWLIYFIFLLCSCFNVFSQAAKQARYRDVLFSKVDVQQNLSYRSALPAGVKKKSVLFDLYQPSGDTAVARPFVIWLHGGGFKFGNKKSRGTPVWSRDFARRGYVCAAINYPLSKRKTLSDFTALADACGDAIEDVQQAVSFFKQHASEYRIDTSMIILAGNSAGGMIALQAVYSSPYEMAQLVHRADAANLSHAHNPMHIAGIISFWGAVFNTAWLANASVPIVCVQGSRDRVVPYDHKGNLPMYGSYAIHKKADSLGIPNSLKTYQGFGHELQKHFNPLWVGWGGKRRLKEAGYFAADFMYNSLFRGR